MAVAAGKREAALRIEWLPILGDPERERPSSGRGSAMSQPTAAPSSFTAPCPGCGQKLRFALAPDMPGRLRIQCFACKATSPCAPGADAAQLSMTGAAPRR